MAEAAKRPDAGEQRKALARVHNDAASLQEGTTYVLLNHGCVRTSVNLCSTPALARQPRRGLAA